MIEKKTLQEKFLDGDKLSLADNLRINLLQRLSESDCDGMCGRCGVWYCKTYQNFTQNKQKYKSN
jgi:hypothetical protein